MSVAVSDRAEVHWRECGGPAEGGDHTARLDLALVLGPEGEAGEGKGLPYGIDLGLEPPL
jgi:hypothetical protein